METHRFGATGVEVPVLGQGTWQIGRGAEVVRTLRRGLDLGMTHIDTAELYTGAEEVVGEAIEGRRDGVFLVSKVLPRNATRSGTVAACERSLRKLRTDRLDGYLLHWHERGVRLEETMAGMLDLLQAGKIRSIGVSNLSVRQLEACQAALGDVPLACNQVRYSMGDREIERTVLPWCEAHGVAVVGYSAFETGSFYEPGSREWAALERVGARHGRTVRQVVLRFLTRRPSLFAIPKASRVAHVEENAGGAGWSLGEEDVRELERAFPL